MTYLKGYQIQVFFSRISWFMILYAFSQAKMIAELFQHWQVVTWAGSNWITFSRSCSWFRWKTILLPKWLFYPFWDTFLTQNLRAFHFSFVFSSEDRQTNWVKSHWRLKIPLMAADEPIEPFHLCFFLLSFHLCYKQTITKGISSTVKEIIRTCTSANGDVEVPLDSC